MGLDVYLRKCPNLDAANAAERAAEAEIDALWLAAGGYEKATEEQKEEIRTKSEEVVARHGLRGAFDHHTSVEEVCQDSTVDPQHLFKVGYFRSSYNGGGLERVMSKLALPGLHEIFDAPGEYEFKPDWQAALVRANEAITAYQAHLAQPAGQFSVMEVRPMFEHGVPDEKAALDAFVQQFSNPNRTQGFDSFSNGMGEFFLSGMTVRAVIAKKYVPSPNGNPIEQMLNSPRVFVIYDRDKPEEGKQDWYLTALLIVRETIEYVLRQDDAANYYLTWSG